MYSTKGPFSSLLYLLDCPKSTRESFLFELSRYSKSFCSPTLYLMRLLNVSNQIYNTCGAKMFGQVIVLDPGIKVLLV